MNLAPTFVLGLLVGTVCAPGTARALCEVVTSVGGSVVPRRVGKVEELYLHRDFVRIDMEGDEMALAGQCTPFERAFLAIPLDEPRLSHYISMLLAAQLSGRSLTVRLGRDAEGMCSVLYMRMSSP